VTQWGLLPDLLLPQFLPSYERVSVWAMPSIIPFLEAYARRGSNPQPLAPEDDGFPMGDRPE